MPKSRQQEHQHDICGSPQLPPPASAQRNVHIPCKKSCKRHVPALPELREGSRLKRRIKIQRQLNSQHCRKPHCHVTVPGKIIIQLQSVTAHGKKDCQCIQIPGALNPEGRCPRQHIRNQKLLRQPEYKKDQSPCKGFRVKASFLRIAELYSDFLVAGNGPLNNLWEIGEIQHIPPKAVPCNGSLIGIDQIRNLAECIERKTDRKTHRQKVHGPL